MSQLTSRFFGLWLVEAGSFHFFSWLESNVLPLILRLWWGVDGGDHSSFLSTPLVSMKSLTFLLFRAVDQKASPDV